MYLYEMLAPHMSSMHMMESHESMQFHAASIETLSKSAHEKLPLNQRLQK